MKQSSIQVVNRISKTVVRNIIIMVLLFNMLLFVSGGNNSETNVVPFLTNTFPETKPALLTGFRNETNPYLISSIVDLKYLRDNLDTLNENHFLLTTNLNFTSNDYDDPSKGWLPIGTATKSFIGSFDGGNYTIHNLWINQSKEAVGLFGYSKANIKNLHLKDSKIEHTRTGFSSSSSSYIGSLAGGNQGIINNTSVTGTITATGINIQIQAGGLVGQNIGYIDNSYADAKVTINVTNGTAFTGGLLGAGIFGEVRNSFADSVITVTVINGISSAGGLVGGGGYNSISYSSANVAVTTIAMNSVTNAGGLIGLGEYIKLDKTSATGTITSISTDGTIYAGGLLGYGSSNSFLKVIDDSFSHAKVITTITNGNAYTGGLAGAVNGLVRNSYSVSTVISNVQDGNVITGGLVGSAGGGRNGNGIFKDLDTFSEFGFITESYSVAVVNATTKNGNITAGGLIGQSNISVHDSYANTTITANTTLGDAYLGGLVGNHIRNSIGSTYAVGNIISTGARYTLLGGLVGRNNGIIRDSYASSIVTATQTGTQEVGGLIGSNLGFVDRSYYDITISKTNDSNDSTKGIPQTTSQLHSNSSHFSTWNSRIWVPGDGFFPVIQVAPNPIFITRPRSQTVINGTVFTVIWAAISENATNYTIKLGNTTLCSDSWTSNTTTSCTIISTELNLGKNDLSITVNGHRNTSLTYTIVITVVPSIPTGTPFSFSEPIPLTNTKLQTTPTSLPTSRQDFIFFPLVSIPFFAIAIICILLKRKKGKFNLISRL